MAKIGIQLLGAPGTGKTRLADELGAMPVFAVDDNPAWLAAGAQPAGPTLLMGLDLPVQPAASAAQQAADRALRAALAQSGITYQVVYGLGTERLHNALNAVQAWLPCTEAAAAAEAGRSRRPAAWVWTCDKCSDPQCERRLLSDLLAARVQAR